ncbi:hypothetical protein [Bowmanella yangjiangensis]|uniref:Uncharacterized protein n=1 Tax=Bowmanella yangjiangensis TaxID=2811230 RepID=A0ABS3D185_9ALTE|nr:hypothetical protein [Bowmanella yangjiangensis]MBN7822569.1 hypothetical protein [Bowmanella yangjiangensis]
MNERPTKEFLAGLVVGQSVRVTRLTGDVVGRVSDIKPRLFKVRIGREARIFLREDGGAFNAPDKSSKSWVLPLEASDHA